MMILKKILVFFVLFISSNSCEGNVIDDWENQYSESLFTTPDHSISCLNHHTEQNLIISKDFLRQITTLPKRYDKVLFLQILKRADSILEVGCGTGELCQEIGKIVSSQKILGVDISKKAVTFANTQNQHPNIAYIQLDCLNKNIKEEMKRQLIIR